LFYFHSQKTPTFSFKIQNSIATVMGCGSPPQHNTMSPLAAEAVQREQQRFGCYSSKRTFKAVPANSYALARFEKNIQQI
jgi:hypothetical protein